MQVIRMGIPFSSYEVLIQQLGCCSLVLHAKRAVLYRTRLKQTISDALSQMTGWMPYLGSSSFAITYRCR
jgi:hypothetical protein